MRGNFEMLGADRLRPVLEQARLRKTGRSPDKQVVLNAVPRRGQPVTQPACASCACGACADPC